jgi:ligand-binding sensor domain-containing protein
MKVRTIFNNYPHSPECLDTWNLRGLMVIPLIICILMFSFPSTSSAITFDLFTDKTIKFKLVQQNDYIWMATNGGAIKWDMINETATEYTTIHGLSDNYCTFIGLDSAGSVWIQSKGGFDRFDGQSWHPITDTSGLINRPGGSRFLLSGPQGPTRYTCYYANSTDTSGFYYYDSILVVASATDTFIDTIHGQFDYKLRYSQVDVAGRLWVPFGTDGITWGYSMFDGTSWHQMPDSISWEQRVPDITTPSVPIDNASGNYTYRFQCIDGGVDTVNCEKWIEFTTVKDSLCIPPSMTIDTAGRLWIGTINGLVRCDETGIREYYFRTGPAGGEINAVAEDTKGGIWFWSWKDGHALFDGKSWVYPEMEWLDKTMFRLSNRMVPSSTDSGGMWFMFNPTILYESSYGDGIAYYNGHDWNEVKVYTKNNGLTSDVIVDMAMDNNNTLWCVCGGDTPSLCRFENDTWTCMALPDDLLDDVRYMYIDRKNNIWIIATNPARFDGTDWKVYPVALYEGRGGCDPLFEDSKGGIWFGTCSRGLYYYNGTDEVLDEINQIGSPGIMVVGIGEDSVGALWVGFGGSWTGSGFTDREGLWKYDETGWKEFSTLGLGVELVNTMICDKTGAMWFCYSPGLAGGASAISRFDGKRMQTFTVKDGLADPRVSEIYTAKNGDLWFLTYNGVSRLKSSELGIQVSKSGQPHHMHRIINTKVLFTSGFRSKIINSAVYYDIQGRRVNLYHGVNPGYSASAAAGIYIKTETGQIIK